MSWSITRSANKTGCAPGCRESRADNELRAQVAVRCGFKARFGGGGILAGQLRLVSNGELAALAREPLFHAGQRLEATGIKIGNAFEVQWDTSVICHPVGQM